jgi:hypothetical protein
MKRKILGFLTALMLTVSSLAFAVTPVPLSDVALCSGDAIWTDVRCYDTLTIALTKVSTNERTLYVPVPITVADSPTILSTTALVFGRDGRITVGGAQTLTIETTSIKAFNRQVFGTTGTITFADNTELRSSWFGGLVNAVSMIGIDNVSLTQDRDETLVANLTTPTTLILKFINNAILSDDANDADLTISGPIIAAPDQQIFDWGNGSGDVLGIKTRYPEWWGISGTTDETQVQQAIDAYAGGAVVLSADGYTLTTAGITLSDADMYFGCPGSKRCVITTAADIDAITISARIICENVGVVNTGSSTKSGFALIDGAKNGEYVNTWAQDFKYNRSFTSIASPGIAYNEFRHHYSGSDVAGGSEFYMNVSGTGWINENKFFGGNGHATNGCLSATLVGNNNEFRGTSFENSESSPDFFAVEEGGTNLIDGARFEMSCNGIRIINGSANQIRMSRVINNHWATTGVELVLKTGRVKTDTLGEQITFNGYFSTGSRGSSTVDVESSLKVVSIADTDGFYVGCTVVLDEGNANEEWNTVASVSDGVSITLTKNLNNTHAIAVVCDTMGLAYGVLSRPQGKEFSTQIWAYGQPVAEVNGLSDPPRFASYGEVGLLDPFNAQRIDIKSRTTELTAMSCATITWAGAIGAGEIIVGISARVITLIEGATSFDVGESGSDTDLYLDGVLVAKDTTGDIADSNATFTGPKAYQSGVNVLVTAVGGAANFSAGALRLTIYYIELTPPTS